MFSKQLLTTFAIWFVSAVSGCSDIRFTQDGYAKAIKSGLDDIPEARQFDELFGKENVDHFISYNGSLKAGSQWFSEVHLGGRYTLTMVVPVKMDRSFDKVGVMGDPLFYMREVVRVSQDGAAATMNPTFEGDYGQFARSQWKRINEMKGDFVAAGIPINPEPVQGFDGYVRRVREPRIQVFR
jgi:hypothetical protein